jgi:SAM-dependent methyltransferase
VTQTESAAAWSEVAAGWERRDPWVSAASRPVTEKLLERLAPQPGEAVLELGGGVGEVGRAVADRVAPGGSVLTTDQSEAMVEVARRRGAGTANLSFRAADAERTGLADASFDAVVGRFVLMLAPSPGAALAETRRVLRPGGRVAFAVWASAPENPWGSTIGKALLDLGLMEPPEPDTPGPFRLGDADRVRLLFDESGLEHPLVDEVPITQRYASFDEFWDVTQDLAMSLRNALAALREEQAAELRRVVEERLARYVDEEGLAIPGLARVFTSRRPASD